MTARCILSLLLWALSTSVGADEVTVAVASNFARPMQAIAQAFEDRTGHRLRMSFGSSGKFYAQIRHGAPFEVLLSADQSKPRALEEAGMAVPGSRMTYALGALALWSPDPALVDDRGQVLKSANFRRLAIANPRLAPYGAAAMEVLKALGLEDGLRDKLVLGENISQTYQFVVSGNAELGLLALSQVTSHGRLEKGSAWLVPAGLYSPIRQDAVLLQPGANQPAASALLDFLHSGDAQSIIRSFGYQIPDPTVAE